VPPAYDPPRDWSETVITLSPYEPPRDWSETVITLEGGSEEPTTQQSSAVTSTGTTRASVASASVVKTKPPADETVKRPSGGAVRPPRADFDFVQQTTQVTAAAPITTSDAVSLTSTVPIRGRSTVETSAAIPLLVGANSTSRQASSVSVRAPVRATDSIGLSVVLDTTHVRKLIIAALGP